MRQLPSRFAQMSATASALQRLERQVTVLHARLDQIETRLNGLKMLRRASVVEGPRRTVH